MLLSAKPVIYAANVADSELAEGNEMVDTHAHTRCTAVTPCTSHAAHC